MTPVHTYILHRVCQSFPQTPPSARVLSGWSRAALAEPGLGGEAEKDRKKGAASGRWEIQKLRQRWIPKGTEQPREMKARKSGERGKGRGQGRKEGRRGKEGERRRCAGGPDRDHCCSLVSSLTCYSGSGLLVLPSVYPPGASSIWQMAAPSCFIWSESDQHSARGQRQLLAWVEKAGLGPLTLWWQRWIWIYSSCLSLWGTDVPRGAFPGTTFSSTGWRQETSFLVPGYGNK